MPRILDEAVTPTRRRLVLTDLGADIHGPTQAEITRALAKARSEGAAQEREECAKLAFSVVEAHTRTVTGNGVRATPEQIEESRPYVDAAHAIANAIRGRSPVAAEFVTAFMEV